MKQLSLLCLIFSVFVLSCKKDEPDPTPPAGPSYHIVTGTVTGITNTGGTVTGNLNNVNGKNITSYGHVWSTSIHPTIDLKTKTTFGAVNTDQSFTSSLDKLQQGTVYYVRAYTTDSVGTFYGTESSFTTVASFFQFVVSSNYLRDDSFQKLRAWVLIYNTNKELIGIKEIFNGQTYSFVKPVNKATDQYMVQLFSYYDYVNPDYEDYFNMSCYLKVDPQVWYLGSEPSQFQQIGTNIVTLSDVDLYDYYYWSAKNQYSYADYDQTNRSLEFPQYFNPDKIWINYFNKGEAPFYKWIGNVGLNQSYTLSSADFTQMSSYVDITLPTNTSSYVYVESEDDLTTDYWEWYDVFYMSTSNMTTIRAYHPDNMFNGYYTSISVRHDNIREYMTKYRGAIPGQFVSLSVNVTVINESINNYSASFSGEADIFYSYWTYTENSAPYNRFNYNIYGSASDISSFSAPVLPQEIRNLNQSLLDLNKLNYAGSYFREYNYISGYQDYIYQFYVQPNTSTIIKEFEYSKYIYKENLKATDAVDDREEIQRVKRH